MKELRIGRSQDCDIYINDPTVSRIHATLLIKGTTYSVRDESSANGTYVNGTRIPGSSPLKLNDILKVGNTVVPWKKYVDVPPSKVEPTAKNNASTTQGRTKKASSVVGLVGALILVLLVAFILLFFYKTQKDELRMSGTWVCDKNCGTLDRLVLGEAVEDRGDLEVITSANPEPRKGRWVISTGDNTLKLFPGLTMATENFEVNGEVRYKYEFNKNSLLLTRIENGDSKGNTITLVKKR